MPVEMVSRLWLMMIWFEDFPKVRIWSLDSIVFHRRRHRRPLARLLNWLWSIRPIYWSCFRGWFSLFFFFFFCVGVKRRKFGRVMLYVLVLTFWWLFPFCSGGYLFFFFPSFKGGQLFHLSIPSVAVFMIIIIWNPTTLVRSFSRLLVYLSFSFLFFWRCQLSSVWYDSFEGGWEKGGRKKKKKRNNNMYVGWRLLCFLYLSFDYLFVQIYEHDGRDVRSTHGYTQQTTMLSLVLNLFLHI